MEENKNKEIDLFFKKQFKEIAVESPSKDFTLNVMEVISQDARSISKSHQSLISKKVWFFLIIIFTAIIFIPFRKSKKTLFNDVILDFTFLEKFSLSSIIDGVSISTTVFYGCVFFALMAVIQVVLIKDFLAKKINPIV